MSEEKTTTRRTRKKKTKPVEYIITFVFLIFTFGMMLMLFILPKSNYSANEKRYLADMPEFSFENLINGDYTKKFEEYITDHIPYRDFYVGVDAYYNLASGRNGSNGIYSGKDGYLMNDPVGDNSLDVFANTEKNIGLFADFAEKNNLNTTLMVVPSTGYVEEDKLPLIHKDYKDDKLFEIIKENKGNMNFVDIRESLAVNQKNGIQLFYKTDHHWTSSGAYVGYINYCASKGIMATGENEYYKEIYDGFKGTTYSSSALWLNPSDNIELWQSTRLGDVEVEITEGKNVDRYNSLFFKNHLTEGDKYPVFLDGNHALTRVKNSKAPLGKKLLVIKDSFSHCLVPFLADNYSEILMVDLRYYKNPVSEIVKNENFNEALVIYGIDNLATDTNVVFLE